MQGESWLVSCGCGANEEFEAYGDARRWQDAHDSACESRTDLWAPELPQKTHAAAAMAAPQALGLARA